MPTFTRLHVNGDFTPQYHHADGHPSQARWDQADSAIAERLPNRLTEREFLLTETAATRV